ncbi:S1 RNA-binding domain-containing protein [Candidatus Kuenenbacteria bacterium]|nr:S1 RNA-binding domain-containing protein [Candidatus Kuenenbacteria bacterium]
MSESDQYGYIESDDETVYLGTIETVTDFGIFVDLGDGREGLLHWKSIPGCKDSGKVADVCKKGNKIKVTIEKVHRRDEKIVLSCVEFPVH